MLGLPERAFADPDTGKRLDEFQLADWLEGCVTFSDESVSQNDVVDVLHENYLTNETDAQSARNNAAMRVKAAWHELSRRLSCLGKSAPYRLNGARIQRECEWHQSPAFAFCLLVGLRPVYGSAFRRFKDFTKQGELFEQLTTASLTAMGWEVHSVGWSKNKANTIVEKVEAVAQFLGVDSLAGASQKWTAPRAKDAGLDLICQYIFKDGWGGRPIILTQCASGKDWEDKLHTPELEVWKKLVDIHTDPTRGLSMPFAIRPERFRRAGMRSGFVMLLDRHRLAVPDKSPSEWIPPSLGDDLRNWMNDRVPVLVETAA